MISKKRIRIILVLLILDITVFWIAWLVGDHQSIFRLALFLLQVVLWILYFRSRRCPFCHRYGGLLFYWSDEDAGHCRHCGQLVKFKENQE